MARLATVGFETEAIGTATDRNSEGQGVSRSGTAFSIDTSNQFDGSRCIKTAEGKQSYVSINPGAVLDRTYYFRIAVKWPKTLSGGEEAWFLNIASATNCGLLNLGGKVSLRNFNKSENTHANVHEPKAGETFLYEVKVLVKTSGKGVVNLRIYDAEGGTVYEGADVETEIGNTAISSFQAGYRIEEPGFIYLSHMCLNDSTGESQNSWMGYEKVVMLRPTSDVARAGFAGDDGGTTNLWKALDNQPPNGFADNTANATDETQIRSANNNSTDYYECETAAYDDPVSEGGGGIVAGDTINTVTVLARGGNSTTTSRNLAVKGAANPEISEVTKGSGSTAAATEPTGWYSFTTAPAYAPSITITEGAKVRVRKGTASTNAMIYDAIGVYVSYLPSEEGEAYEVVAKETITISDAFSREVKFQRTFAETVTVNDALAKKFGLTLGETVTINDALSKKFGKVLGETVTINDALASELGLPGGMYVFLEGEWQLTALRIF